MGKTFNNKNEGQTETRSGEYMTYQTLSITKPYRCLSNKYLEVPNQDPLLPQVVLPTVSAWLYTFTRCFIGVNPQ